MQSVLYYYLDRLTGLDLPWVMLSSVVGLAMVDPVMAKKMIRLPFLSSSSLYSLQRKPKNGKVSSEDQRPKQRIIRTRSRTLLTGKFQTKKKRETTKRDNRGKTTRKRRLLPLLLNKLFSPPQNPLQVEKKKKNEPNKQQQLPPSISPPLIRKTSFKSKNVLQEKKDGSQRKVRFALIPTNIHDTAVEFLPPPLPPKEVPLRFIRACKGNLKQAQLRYEQTLLWRKQHDMNYLVNQRAHPHFHLIKQHYPHYFHLRSRKNEPVFYEKPSQGNIRALFEAGMSMDDLIRHYAMITEFGWQFLERNDLAQSVTVFDLKGARLADFVSDSIEFVRKATAFSGQHYPERVGHIYIIHVPSWFQLIWSALKSFVDKDMLEKITVLRNANQVLDALKERIPIENIPPEYGGTSVPLGKSPEEQILNQFVDHTNRQMLTLDTLNSCCYCKQQKEEEGEGCDSKMCRFCSWVYARSY